MMWGIVFHNTPMQTPHGLNIAPILMSIWIHSIWKEDENKTASTKTGTHCKSQWDHHATEKRSKALRFIRGCGRASWSGTPWTSEKRNKEKQTQYKEINGKKQAS